MKPQLIAYEAYLKSIFEMTQADIDKIKKIDLKNYSQKRHDYGLRYFIAGQKAGISREYPIWLGSISKRLDKIEAILSKILKEMNR